MRKRALAFMVAAMALATVAGTSAHAGTQASPAGRRFRLPYVGSVSSTGDAFHVTNTGSGNSIEGDGTAGVGVWGQTSTGFAAVLGRNTGNAAGVEGVTVGNSGTGAVYGYTSGTGAGVFGESDGGGAGVYGTSLGSGPGAKFTGGLNNAPALELNGGIKIDGAGNDTATPVFVHQTLNSNLCNSGYDTILDHPSLNGNPNAYVFLQSFDASWSMAAAYLNLNPPIDPANKP
jgi:hypothetical protein